MLTSSQCYGIGAVLAVGVIGGLGYYVYQAKKGEVNAVKTLYLLSNPLRLTSLKWSNCIINGQDIVNDLYMEDMGKLVAIVAASEMTRVSY